MNGPAKVLASGGGVWNEWLIHQIERRSGQEIIIPSDEVVNFKEALIFAWLGLRRIKGLSNVSASVTGASADSSSGAIWGSPFTIS
jgi:anhydro-N-acetylmuramic acid kinase